VPRTPVRDPLSPPTLIRRRLSVRPGGSPPAATGPTSLSLQHQTPGDLSSRPAAASLPSLEWHRADLGRSVCRREDVLQPYSVQRNGSAAAAREAAMGQAPRVLCPGCRCLPRLNPRAGTARVV